MFTHPEEPPVHLDPQHTQALLHHFVHFLRSESISEATVRLYASHVSAYLQAIAITSTDPMKCGRDAVVSYLNWLRGRGNNPSSVDCHQTALRRFYAWAADTGITSANPLAKRLRITIGRRLPKAITQEQAVMLLESVNGDDALSLRDRAMLELLYASGLRAAELLNMRLYHLDLGRRIVRIMGKGRVEAIVTYGEQAELAMRRWIKDGRPTLTRRETHDRVWVNCFGGPLVYDGLRRMLRVHSRAAGLPMVRPHMLRHSFATHLMERGAHLRVIQELMRHSSVRSTQIYLHLDTARLAEERGKYHPRG
jgi:site-specific recombinase XerD